MFEFHGSSIMDVPIMFCSKICYVLHLTDK
jgi:hypothetical protein